MATTAKQNTPNEVKALKERVAELESLLAEDTGKPLNATTPAIVDLGRAKGKKIKALKKGEGALLDEVWDVVQHVNESLDGKSDDKILVPIVMIYRKRRKRKLGGLFL